MHWEALDETRREPRLEHEHFIFEGADFPASKQDLLDLVSSTEVDPRSLNLIQALPDRVYKSRNDVWRSIGEASRVMIGAPGWGSPRDDIGKEAVRRPSIRHP